ncbi:UNKNOWN [Stylonychia lemnae]|uniref:Uncharacterized protein n=1 Tax=Stylonychia lemnae TaxID=5949 RepID=A0A078A1E9_STYLE|nr:UNKNOWN [Stylonychia lemnae]|eukprot:CDW74604.1 UNKNOWN [Stylonychia lemnae]
MQTATAVEISKCKQCACGSKLAAQYVCLLPEKCNNQFLYCDDENCSSKHDHRMAKITSVMQHLKNQVGEFREKVSTLKSNLSDLFPTFEKLVKFYTASQKALSQKNSPQDGKKYRYLDELVAKIDKLYNEVDSYSLSLDELQIEYKLEEMIKTVDVQGERLKEEFTEVATLAKMDEELLWNIYEEAISTDYVNQELMDKFSPSNWNTYHGLQIKALKSKLDKKEAEFQAFKTLVEQKLQI